MTQVKLSKWDQAAVELATGLSREVLRKWELRYQFPRPARGERGERQYSNSDVQRLQLINRLLKSGLRAGAVVPLSRARLQSLMDARSSQHTSPKAISEDEAARSIQTLLKTLAPAAAPTNVALFLQEKLQQNGLAVFVAHCLPIFNQAVGDAWLTKRLSVVAEHRYTDTVQQIVLRALPAPGHAHTRPRVLLTTPPGELHSLGLLALHAQLSLHGADCINLGTQAPLAPVLQAAHDMQVGVVAVSASSCLPLADLRDYLSGLRAGLPSSCVLWAGGQGCTRLTPQEQTDFNVMTDTASALRHWLTLAKAQRVAN
jgi:DNA-binding transcriptional MerR regulator/methylmalonyl-CoA mutase cobalamin-binding subunit